MKIRKVLSCLVFLFLFSTSLFGQGKSKINMSNLPSLPALEKGSSSLGFAGMMGGMHNGMVIVAGGANFPSGLPWEGGAKKWYNSIYILEKDRWKLSSQTLPIPLGYGASVSTEKGILIIGGDNQDQVRNNVILLAYNQSKKDIDIISYPDLPEPLAYLSAVFTDGYVYVAGGMNSETSSNSFYRLNLEGKSTWEKLQDFPGEPRALQAMVVQETSHSKNIFLIGGRNQRKGQLSKPLTQYVSYDLDKKLWINKGDLIVNGKPRIIMGAVAEPMGSMHILLYGGSDDLLFTELESLGQQLNQVNNDSLAKKIIAQRDQILNTHPGFSKEILAFNSITDKWFVYDTVRVKLPVTTLGIKKDNNFLIVSGEISPGIRTPEVYSFTVDEPAHAFGALNYTVLALYLFTSLMIGVYFARKQKSTDDYFMGGGRIPWWASGLSVFGTLLSAITFMAIPAKAFVTDWSFFLLNIAAIIITPLIAFLFIPYFNRMHISTAYEYLEKRFNYLARAIGSISFILFQLGRIGIVLLLPSLAISIVTGISVETCILLMGLLCVLYTTFGGIEAVIWTDVLQVIVLMGGSIVAIVWIMLHTETPFNEMIAYASEREKFNIINFDFNFTDSTFWVVLIGGLASAMVTQGTDQTIVQRYLTSSSIKNSQKTLYTNALLTLPATIIFFGIGTLLYIFYTEMPERLSPAISNNDSLFPWYIVRELPVGVSGLLIAGIFSAAMSSISSSLNSVSTAFCNDLYKRRFPKLSDLGMLKVARIVTVFVGIIGVLLALWMANANIKSLWDQFYRFLGLFTGGLGGMFLLGMLTKRANSTGTLMGLVVSGILLWYISVYTSVNFLMYSFIGVASCFGFGYVFSLFFTDKTPKVIRK
ncbi:N-acetylneuraminate epimerase [Arenibacter antarcticus]|uniref:Sodium/solute symporter n=1 Tax=Arenibacter antarcticus TaxID=2040469 RepID=A0ABW5VI85_9FLAO|nr:sodium/solute symporter [Arenibacter sp. H213]MCM4166546.1 sodium transporter [Arenibacter sp. H213]